jgi:hypothetical protein
VGTPTPLFRTRVGPVQGVALHPLHSRGQGDGLLVDTLLEQAAPPLTILLNWRALQPSEAVVPEISVRF